MNMRYRERKGRCIAAGNPPAYPLRVDLPGKWFFRGTHIISSFRVLLVCCTLVWPTAGLTDEGSDIYRQACAICHAAGIQGIPGVPKLGVQADWGNRLVAGRPEMLHSVLRGKGAMPPKGGNASLSDTQAGAALDYMLSKVNVKK